jgi:uncharacterized protein YdhG (YjbR/CyaY superfamily)
LSIRLYWGLKVERKTAATTIHFSAENPLPATLVENIVKARVEENELCHKNKQK